MAQTGGNKRSDTPTRAKKLKSMVLKGAEKVKTKKNTGDSRQKTGERQRQEEWKGGRIIRRVLDS
jgi:hypothetical protein